MYPLLRFTNSSVGCCVTFKVLDASTVSLVSRGERCTVFCNATQTHCVDELKCKEAPGDTPILEPLELKGLFEPVYVTTDYLGRKRILAKNDHDAYIALGYFRADLDFPLLDHRRHLTKHRLAELYGAGALGTDDIDFLRDPYPDTETRVASDPVYRDIYPLMVSGINQWIETHDLPSFYSILGITKEKFVRFVPSDLVPPTLGSGDFYTTDLTIDNIRRAILLAGGNDTQSKRFAAEDAYAPGWTVPPNSYPIQNFVSGTGKCSTVPLTNSSDKRKRSMISHAEYKRFLHSRVSAEMMEDLYNKTAEFILQNPTTSPEQDERRTMSNFLLVSGKHTVTGKPMYAAGPDIDSFFNERGRAAPTIVVENDPVNGPLEAISFFPTLTTSFRTKDIATALTAGYGDTIDYFMESINCNVLGEPISTNFFRTNTTRAIQKKRKEFFVNNLSGNIVSGLNKTYYIIPEKKQCCARFFYMPSWSGRRRHGDFCDASIRS